MNTQWLLMHSRNNIEYRLCTWHASKPGAVAVKKGRMNSHTQIRSIWIGIICKLNWEEDMHYSHLKEMSDLPLVPSKSGAISQR